MAHIINVLDTEFPILNQLWLLVLSKVLYSAFDLKGYPHMHRLFESFKFLLSKLGHPPHLLKFAQQLHILIFEHVYDLLLHFGLILLMLGFDFHSHRLELLSEGSPKLLQLVEELFALPCDQA